MQIKLRYRPLALALCGTLCISLHAGAQIHTQKTPVSEKALPLDPAVRAGKLSNGFTYYIRHNEEPKNRVIFYLANKVGSVLESEDQRGLAHFMEHMSFNGTKHFPKNELIDYLQKAGVRFGADINAYTSFDETVYQLPLPSDDPKILQNGIQIMRDWAQGATLEPVEIDKERGVVLEEKRLGKGAGERMQRKYWPVILNNSRYAVRIPIGIDEVLNNFKPETIRKFYHDWYRPDLQALIVVGDVNVDQIEKAVKVKFGDLKNPEHERIRTKYTVPLTSKNQFIAVTDPEMTATSAELTFKRTGLPLHTAAQYREGMVRQLFNTMTNDRYGELQRQADPPFLQGGAGFGSFMGGLDSYTISVVAKPGELEKGFKAVWKENERVRQYGFNSTELERAKTSYVNQFEAVLKEKNKTGSNNYVNEYLQYFLNGTAAPGIDYEYRLIKGYIAGITLAELNEIAKSAIKSTDRDIVVMAPEKDKAGLPNEQSFMNWINEIKADKIVEYKDETNKGNLLTSLPTPGKIISEQRDDKLGITTILFGNDVKVLLKPTDFKNNEISFSGFAPGGSSLYSDADFQSASAANLIPAFGIGNFNTTQLDKYLSGKQLSVRPFIGERSQGINGGAVINDLETSLQLLYAYFTEPRKDSLLFQNFITRSKAGLMNRASSPGSVFQDTVSAVLGAYNIRRTGPTPEKIDQINLDKAYTIYKERFADASGFTFVFVGSIDIAAIKPLLARYLGSLPALQKNEEAKDLHIHIPEGLIEKIVYKGTEPKATVRLIFSGQFDYSFDNIMKMDALKEVLQIRLTERLREDESGVYSPSARVSTVKYPQGNFNLSVSFGCAPQNVDKLIASALDEISKLRTSGPDEINLNKFKAEDERVMEIQLKTNDFWLGYLSGQLENKEPLDQFDQYPEMLKRLKPADVQEIAKQYLTGKNYIRLVLMPENTSK